MRSTPIAVAAFAVATVCLVTNPLVAQAARDLITGKDIKDGTLTSADVRDRSLRLEDFKRGQLESGPAGPQGEAGPPGADGEEAFARIVPIAETLPEIVSAARGVDALLTAEMTLEVEAGQRVMMGGSVGLGTATPQTVSLWLCLYDADQNWRGARAGDGRVGISMGSFGMSAVSGALPAGTYTGAPCAVNEDGTLALTNNGRFVGWIAVVNGPSDGAASGGAGRGTPARTAIVTR